jgi:hypothetical protein
MVMMTLHTHINVFIPNNLVFICSLWLKDAINTFYNLDPNAIKKFKGQPGAGTEKFTDNKG